MADTIEATGLAIHPGMLSPAEQRSLLAQIQMVMKRSPLYRPTMPRTGKPFSVMMTNCGTLGWVADKAGYRYQPRHPETGKPWPPIPDQLTALWTRLGAPATPEACLVNIYDEGARLGMHQDSDEATFDAPVVSVSLGDTAVFRMGGTTRRGPTRSVRLSSGDVVVFGGPSRLMYHGIDRVLSGSSRLIEGGGRINLTLRRVTPWTDAAAS
ncbi:alpha-ketoglutarate-dependent dioxygenase AlkB [Acuticoccus sp. I52.16.1]|uniref:alpha-ketoglutarate-dependent dioxygenase AlkB n=1 Tax=Acuticoccus sp. I52.16.1 TaxID=2928472 RepID=UPI001FD35706|nr:alpha-ketoglutarate-dependent dioxygenase AlkB [Acuticoccus sp. I52.16.1]UOM35971.1 alpha-ketoglutarate-dependent dioxygenase AlkB [Acuticoccus sp. I52.16.1]